MSKMRIPLQLYASFERLAFSSAVDISARGFYVRSFSCLTPLWAMVLLFPVAMSVALPPAAAT